MGELNGISPHLKCIFRLAEGGPTKSFRLDHAGLMEAVVASISLRVGPWTSHFIFIADYT